MIPLWLAIVISVLAVTGGLVAIARIMRADNHRGKSVNRRRF